MGPEPLDSDLLPALPRATSVPLAPGGASRPRQQHAEGMTCRQGAAQAR
ncbi:MAG: hypothetical protein JWO49_2440 [Arthrobacter sp.]|nr:hypothetical protein [Arthrobacter sp.]MCU1548700.1 hypothetical protein [Arthrobacter sp.]